jgi:hypothetical protein
MKTKVKTVKDNYKDVIMRGKYLNEDS